MGDSMSAYRVFKAKEWQRWVALNYGTRLDFPDVRTHLFEGPSGTEVRYHDVLWDAKVIIEPGPWARHVLTGFAVGDEVWGLESMFNLPLIVQTYGREPALPPAHEMFAVHQILNDDDGPVRVEMRCSVGLCWDIDTS